MAEYLYIVICKSEQAKPYCGDEQKYDIDVRQVGEQQHRYEYGQDYDYPSHGGGALLLELSFKSQVADFFPDLPFLQPQDDFLAENQRYEYGCGAGKHGPERQVGEKPLSRDVRILEKFKQMVYHCTMFFNASDTISFSSK